MIDINEMAQRTLSQLDCSVVYYCPDKFTELPAVSFYTLSERPCFGYDNTETEHNGTIQLDIWTKSPEEGGALAIKVNEIMSTDGWCREFSMDLPKSEGVYHKTMRYVKGF